MEADEVDLAIDRYDRALAVGYEDQEGILLNLRSAAHLERAYGHRIVLDGLGQTALELSADYPARVLWRSLASLALTLRVTGSMVEGSMPMAHADLIAQVTTACLAYQRAAYHYRLYRTALLQSYQDAIRATRLIPTFSTPFIRAAEILVQLVRFKEAAEQYRGAANLNPSLASSLAKITKDLEVADGVIERLRLRGLADSVTVPVVLEKLNMPHKIF